MTCTPTDRASRSKPKALLLAAGLGTRLRPLTNLLPKCLMPICGRPLLGYWLETLDRAGFETIVVNLHHRAELVRRYVEESRHAARVKLSQEDRLLGTGGTLLVNRRILQGSPILVAHADNLSVFDAKELLQAHARRPKHCVMTMMVFRAADPSSCGIVELDEHSVVRAFHEKVDAPPDNLANGAVYVFEESIFDELAELGRDCIDLSTEVLPSMVGRAFSVENRQLHRDIGTLGSLIEAQFEMSLLFNSAVEHVDDSAWRRLMQAGSPSLAQQFVSLMAAVTENSQYSNSFPRDVLSQNRPET